MKKRNQHLTKNVGCPTQRNPTECAKPWPTYGGGKGNYNQYLREARFVYIQGD